MRRAWRRLAGAVILAVVVWQVGSASVVEGLRSLDVPVLLLGASIALVTTVACAWRWHLVARELGVQIAMPAAVASCYRAQLLNTVLPGGVLGDVHRGVAHGRSTGETGRALRAVGWERAAGQVVQAVVAVLVVGLLPSAVRPALTWVLAGLVVLAAVAVLAVRSARGDGWWGRLARTARDDVRLALLVRRSWPGVVVASLVALAGYVATYVVAARAVGVEASVATLLPLVLVVLLAAGLPLNLAGWGPREGMAAWAFAVAGLGAATGVATAVAYGAMVLVANLPGLVVVLASGHRTTAPATIEGRVRA
ncbi:lysylphosphatidylglycerol synthase transmembrane domain-containing protein [Nocardioides sp. STR2]|uniref:Lysylphosphatidylglycerol synthase transmembrane domain-containing protein n=1 Tax=Nocardioides pini TaxID=2975053 RepID=A0ABT4CEI6_9ACTN|nr:lysylphosphatidylglycerol synthase transmembrane domain-containing protein [Nocardioides pini]MCY4726519.1 lysylphosphatidylglycerol synthase transmembrane domain-containing protein [Nocardioides pini]